MNSEIDYILSKNDLVAMAERAGTQMRKCTTDWRGACPLHSGEDKNSFSVYSEGGKQKWKCFSSTCGTGDIIDFYMAWQKVDLKAAIKYFVGDQKPDPATMTRIASERAEKAEQQLKQTIELAQAALKDLREARAWERYHEALENSVDARELWNKRGVPQVWQDIWHLGYCDTFRVNTSEGTLITPTLTMPIFGHGWELLNIRHRLLSPFNPKDKYRPDKPGLQSQAFMTDPDAGMDANNFLIVEGEIKSMVVYITLDSTKWQVLGIPGKSWFRKIEDQLKGKRVVICFDPDADIEAEKACMDCDGKMIRLPVKIDDIINEGGLDQAGLRNLIKGAAKP